MTKYNESRCLRVRVLPSHFDGLGGVGRYGRSLISRLVADGCELVTDDGYDVLHLVDAHRYDAEWREAKRRGKKLVVTVHDLIPEHLGLKGSQYAGVSERCEVLSAADAIIAVSKYTKDDIIATYDIPAAKIHVILNGVDRPSSSLASPSPATFILWVGRRAGYKNFFWFVRAVAPLLWRKCWGVICTGGQDFGRKERLLLGLLGLSRRFKVVQADEAQMEQLYRRAICLVMPSKMEGFGLPLIEAMANDCPVVVPKAHVFPEIAGQAAAYYEMGDAKGLRRQIEKCTNAAYRTDMVERGCRQASHFSWEKCAKKVRKVYELTGYVCS